MIAFKTINIQAWKVQTKTKTKENRKFSFLVADNIRVKANGSPLTILHTEQFNIKYFKLFWAEKCWWSNLKTIKFYNQHLSTIKTQASWTISSITNNRRTWMSWLTYIWPISIIDLCIIAKLSTLITQGLSKWHIAINQPNVWMNSCGFTGGPSSGGIISLRFPPGLISLIPSSNPVLTISIEFSPK